MVSIVGNPATTSPTPTPLNQQEQDLQAGVNGSSSAAHDAGALNQNFNQFLTLLTTQLQNQDPLSPMDSTQFTNQLVSFSGVEQQIKMNDKLTQMLNNTKANMTTMGLSFIGLNVNVNSTQFDYDGQDGTTVNMNYTLPQDANSLSVHIVDANGTIVNTITGAEQTKGSNQLVWNGKNQEGNTVPAGTYRLQIGALDAAQKAITVQTVVPGYVTGISTAGDGTINLLVGKISTQAVPLTSVTEASL